MDDVVSLRRPGDPPWRSGTAHRHLDPDVALMLADARSRRGWPVAEAAARIGISARMVRYLEAGQRVPSQPVAEDIISAYRLGDVDADALREVALPHVGRDSPYRHAT